MMGVTDRLHDRLGELADIDKAPRAASLFDVGSRLIRR
jgi:hypothetical protein